jgi:hypothetical protein
VLESRSRRLRDCRSLPLSVAVYALFIIMLYGA